MNKSREPARVGQQASSRDNRQHTATLPHIDSREGGGEDEDPLGEQFALGVRDEGGVAGIGDGGVEGVDQSELLVGLAEQEDAGVGGDLTTGEVRVDCASAQARKRHGVCGPLCHRDGSRLGKRVGVVTSFFTNTWAVALSKLTQSA